MDFETPEYDSPANVGDEIQVLGSIGFRNQAGGSESIPANGMICRVDRMWWDYETGWRFAGTLLDAEGIEAARLKGQTQYGADYWRAKHPDQPEHAERAEKAAAEFDPSKVYFSEHDLVARPETIPGMR